MMYNQEYYLVNDILAEWDPIRIPDSVAKTEYTDYVQRILSHRNSLNDIIEELEKILTNDIGLKYNPNDTADKDHTIKYATKIYKGLKNYKLIDLDELIDKVEKDKTNSGFKRAAKGLINAMNDWPTGLTVIEDFINEAKNDFGGQVIANNLEGYSNFNEAWKMESTASIIEMLNCFPDKSFDEIVRDISNHYKAV